MHINNVLSIGIKISMLFGIVWATQLVIRCAAVRVVHDSIQ